MASCYILISKSLNRFYIGSTELEVNERINQHNFQHYGKNKFTATAKDWQCYLEISCKSIAQARKIEMHIKRMKSSNYIQNLVKYPNLVKELMVKFDDVT